MMCTNIEQNMTKKHEPDQGSRQKYQKKKPAT